MADQITPEERAAIDAAMGRKQVIPAVEDGRGRRKSDRQAQVKNRAEAGETARQIADALGVHVQTIYADAKSMGVKLKRARGAGRGDVASKRKAERGQQKAAEVRDRRRFMSTPVPMGEPQVLADADAERTIFPDRVFAPDGEELVLKDGCNNSKIGGDVLVGWLKGAYIATLTLEERATCPRSCLMWHGCYGNSMHFARRWSAGPELEGQIRDEVAMACDKNDRVLIRLHVLGDFYSINYLQLWADLLDRHDNLFIFGFTAHLPDTKLGRGIAWLREQAPRRFMVRTSGQTGKWGSFTLPFPTDKKQIGDAIVCPEQLDAMSGGKRGVHCGNCAACWSTDRPIAFVEH